MCNNYNFSFLFIDMNQNMRLKKKQCSNTEQEKPIKKQNYNAKHPITSIDTSAYLP